MPEENGDQEYQFDYCGDPNSHKHILDCTQYFINKELLTQDFDLMCKDQVECDLNMLQYVYNDPDSELYKNAVSNLDQ